jgi:anti-sigma regulatory factor (Ser/Thr protein kinase)
MATALYAIVDRRTGAIEYCSAGHPPPLVIGERGTRFLEGGGSTPLGTAYPVSYADAHGNVETGATLLLYTDGLVERRDASLDARLARLADLARTAEGELGEVCDAIVDGMLGASGAPDDDVALLAVRLEPAPERLALRLPADPEVLADVRRRVSRLLRAADATDQEQYEITLTISEAAANAIEHAYGPGDAEFDLEVRLLDGEVLATVRDHGRWREQRTAAEGTRGRGLGIIEGLMDNVEVTRSDAGTTVRMRRRLEPSEAA